MAGNSSSRQRCSARQLLSLFGIEVAGWVTELGGVVLGGRGVLPELREIRNSSEIYSLHPEQDNHVKDLIDRVGKDGDTLGGLLKFVLTIANWSWYSHRDRKLDGQLHKP